MARKLSQNEFFAEIAKRCDITPQKAKKFWNESIDLIVNELLVYGQVHLPFMSDMKSETRGGKIMHVPISSKVEDRGKTKEVYKEPYQVIRFLPTPKFRAMINGEGATTAQTMRMREIYRRIKVEEEELERQSEYMKKAENAFAEAVEKHKKNTQQRKEWNKLSRKKRKEILEKELKENSYWNDFDDEEEESEDNNG